MVALLSFFAPSWDNPELAWLNLTVHPEHRRRGFGSEGLRFLLDRAAAAGRTKIGADSWDGSPGNAFLEKHGFTRGSQAINRRQHLAEVSLDDVRKRYDEAAEAASAYELVRVVGATPPDLMPAVAEMSAAINDAPLDDLDIDDEVFPPERITAYEQAQLANEMRFYRLLARHRETGVLAGHTRGGGRGGARHHRAPARHHGRPQPPRAPAGPPAQDRHDPVAGGGGAPARDRRHLERRVQRPHDLGQRGAGLPVDGARAPVHAPHRLA